MTKDLYKMWFKKLVTVGRQIELTVLCLLIHARVKIIKINYNKILML